MFRLQGFVLELVTSQLSAFLPFTSIVGSKDSNVFARVGATWSWIVFKFVFESSVALCVLFLRVMQLSHLLSSGLSSVS